MSDYFLYSPLGFQVLVEKMGFPEGSKDVQSGSKSTILRKFNLLVINLLCWFTKAYDL